MQLRSFLYKINIFERVTINVPVISVGNLTLGGSGKTPVAIYIASLLIQRGNKPAVISRGYKGKAHLPANIVSDGVSILLDSTMAGDEPRMIAESVPGLVVLTGKKRKVPCQLAVNKFGCDVIILDDGFQHQNVNRDINLVLFNATSLFSHWNVFPSGYLREPFSALSRADTVILTSCGEDNIATREVFKKKLEKNFPDVPVFTGKTHATALMDKNGRTFTFDHITEPVLSFCGIGAPERFFSTLKEIGINSNHEIIFKDHENYTQRKIDNIEMVAERMGIKICITTMKDLVKLKNLKMHTKVFCVLTSFEFEYPSFETFLMDRLSQITQIK